MRKLLSVILALALAFSLIPLGQVLTVIGAENNTAPTFPCSAVFAAEQVTLYSAVGSSDTYAYNAASSQGKAMPATQTVTEAVTDDSGSVWYRLKVADWWKTLQSFPYVRAQDLMILNAGNGQNVSVAKVNGYTCTAAGNFPANATLNITPVSLANIPGFDTDVYALCDQYAALDIRITTKKGAEWQPAANETVTVQLPAAMIGLADDDCFYFYHVHDGITDVSAAAPVRNGSLMLTVSSFSDFVVSGGSVQISGVKYWYNVNMSLSGNNNAALECVYYDTDNNVHILLSAQTNNIRNMASKMDETYVNGLVVTNMDARNGNYKNPTFGDIHTEAATSCKLYDAENGNLLTTYSGGATGYVDIKVGAEDPNAPKVTIDEILSFYVKSTTGGGGNAWNIGSAENPIVITPTPEYTLKKTVYSVNGDTSRSGDNVAVDPGDTVIYAITVNNAGEFAIYDVTIADAPPAGVLENCSVGATASAETVPATNTNGDIVVATGINLAVGESRTYYVKGTVSDGVEGGVYVNAAKLSAAGLVPLTATADILVGDPAFGELTLTKNVAAAAPTQADAAYIADSEFTFNLYDESGTLLETITLKDGQSTTKVLPTGTYTVSERPLYRFTCAWDDGKTTAVISKDAVTALTCTNAFEGTTIETGSLTVSKSVTKEDAADNIPEGTEFTFTVTDADGVSFGTVNLADGGSYTFDGLPVGSYTVTETPVDGFICQWTNNAYTVNITADATAIADCINAFGHTVSFTSLTIKKTGAEDIDRNQTFLFRVAGAATDDSTKDIDLIVTVHGNGQTTIQDLPVGQYTVTEQNEWSWRYTANSVQFMGTAISDGAQITLSADGTENILQYENTRSHTTWLDGDHFLINLFTGTQP